MREDNIGFLPVCDQLGKVLGTLTDRDIAIRVVADGRLPTTMVEDVMTSEVVACSPKDTLEKAEALAREGGLVSAIKRHGQQVFEALSA